MSETDDNYSVAMAAPTRPTEAIAMGLCPSCLGRGMVHKFVPNEHIGHCSSCGGAGTLAAMRAHLSDQWDDDDYDG